MWSRLTRADMHIRVMHYCLETDVNQSLTMATYTKLCGIPPHLIYLLLMTIYETSNWVQRERYMYRPPCLTEYNPDYYSRDRIKYLTAEITMQVTIPNTMTISIQNTMPYLFRRYITMPNKIPTQAARSWAAQLQWQLTTTNRLRYQPQIKPFQSEFHMRLYLISRRWYNEFKNRGITIQESRTIPPANNYRPGSADSMHR